MKVLVINAGSSSLKYQLLDPETGHLLAKGVRTALQEEGAIGILTGGLTAAAAGITTSLVCGVVCSWVGRSHDQN